MAQLNPFRPQSPISRGMFVGRRGEIRRLESILKHAKHRQPTNFLITGARGIGKTSLLYYFGALAKSYGDIDTESYNFLTVNIAIDDTTSQIEFVKKIEIGIARELEKVDVAQNALKKVWEFLQRIEVAGFSIEAAPEKAKQSEGLLLEAFGQALIEVVDRTCNPDQDNRLFSDPEFDGLLILIDEADQSPPALNLGRFLKYLTEYLHKADCARVTFGLCGLGRVVEILTASHRSSLRLFEEISLGPLSETETNNLLDVCLERGPDKLAHRIESSARRTLSWLAEGHPHFLHQFGYCAFNACLERHDADKEKADREMGNAELAGSFIDDGPLLITNQDVLQGAFGKRGALEIIGDMYFHDFYRHIENSKLDIRVVKYLCSLENNSATADEIAEGIGEVTRSVEKVLTELSAMEHIVHDAFSGKFRIPFACFSHWIDMKTEGIKLESNALR